MAGKDVGNRHKGGTPGAAANAGTNAADDNGAIRELIDGVGSGKVNREDGRDGEANDGDGSESRERGSESARSGSESGIGGTESGSAAGTGTGTGDNRRTRNRSRSARRTPANAASEETRDSSEDVSRTIRPPKQPKIEPELDSLPSVNGEIIGDMFAFTFWGIAQATGIPEWELDDDDAAQIGKNGDKWLKSLGKKRAQNIVKNLSKIGPSLAFFGSVGMALVPRVKLTINVAKHGTLKPIKERQTRNGGGSAQSVAAGGSPTARSANDTSGAASGARPFTAQDFSEVTQGFAGTDDGLPVS